MYQNWEEDETYETIMSHNTCNFGVGRNDGVQNHA